MKVTWKHDREDFPDHLSSDDKIEIFYQQCWGWQLRIADLMANGGTSLDGDESFRPIRHSGFAVLHVCFSYFETIGQCLGASKSSRSQFYAGVRDVFPSLTAGPQRVVEGLLKKFYEHARCGLYHSSRTRGRVGLGQHPGGAAAVFYDADRSVLVFSPERLPQALLSHLDLFRARLLEDKGARASFERWFDRESS